MEQITSCPVCEFEWTEPTEYIIEHYCLCTEHCNYENDEHYCYID